MKILSSVPRITCCADVGPTSADWRRFKGGPEASIRCNFQARYEIEDKHYCTDHAAKLALKILFKQSGIKI
jgi:hypothetical protein